ncbi:unnamed protein product [Prorocentrum cordatum]|uniref:Uncharacterized protein n=1 Tax=Prorocentrum cordatum TaxID=2364126 RepID=A0ABN9W505_9DINO|nr:unnamed protein product [Polarella glacialis]
MCRIRGMFWLSTLQGIPVLQAEVNDATIANVASEIVGMAASHQVATTATAQTVVRTAVILDTSNWEAMAAAMVVVRMLAPRFMLEPTDAPLIIPASMSLPDAVTYVLFICTNGALVAEPCVRTIVAAKERGLPVLPIIAEDNFLFPSKNFVDVNRHVLSQILRSMGDHENNIERFAAIPAIFNTIGVTFNVKMESELGLKIRSEEIHERIRMATTRVVYHQAESGRSRDSPTMADLPSGSSADGKVLQDLPSGNSTSSFASAGE